MGLFRSGRALAIAAVAAAAAYAWTSSHGAPSPINALAALGSDPLDARGGVVIDVRVPADAVARAGAAAFRAVARRLASWGDDVAQEPRGDREVRFVAIGAPPERADAIVHSVTMGGRLELGVVLEHGALIDRLAAKEKQHDDPNVTGDIDSWPVEDSTERHWAPYLYAYDQRALERAVASLGDDPDAEIIDEYLQPLPRARDPRPYWRTYVVSRKTWMINDAIVRAAAQWDPNTDKPIVWIDFDRDGARRFGDLTAALVGHKLAIMLDGRISSAPVVNGPIRGGSAIITMGGTDVRRMEDDADELVAALQAGATMPVPVGVRVVRTVEPSVVRVTLARLVVALLVALAVLVLVGALRRWPALRAAPASSGRTRAPLRLGPLALRIAVTIAVPLALYALRGVTAPGIELEQFGVPAGPVAPGAKASIMALGISPLVLAYVLVALGFAGGWAGRRAGDGPRGARVGVTIAIATAFAVIAGWEHTSFLADLPGEPLLDESTRWEVAAAMAGGCALYALGALAIDRWGLGRGWSAMLALGGGIEAVDRLHAIPTATTMAVAALVALVALIATRTRIVDGAAGVRLPLAGVIGAGALPVGLALLWSPLLRVPALFDVRVIALELARPLFAIPIAAVIALAFGIAWTRRLHGGTRVGAIAMSVAIAAGGTAIAPTLAGDAALGLAAALIAAAVLDAAVEARARARGAWTSIAQIDDVDAADAMLGDSDGGPPRVARGIHVRALLRFFAPMVPVEILEARAAEPSPPTTAAT